MPGRPSPAGDESQTTSPDRSSPPPPRHPAVARLEQAGERFDELHVLLRHRLLRQPHGLEGFGAVEVCLDADYLTLSNGVDPARRHIELGAASLAAPGDVQAGKDIVGRKAMRSSTVILKLSNWETKSVK